MTKSEFVLSSVALQIGGFEGPIAQSTGALRRALQGCSGGALAHSPDDGGVVRLTDGVLQAVNRKETDQPGKTTTALKQICSYQPRFGLVVDMQDRRVRTLADAGDRFYPVFCFNRQAGDTARILWPLPGYHDLSGDHFLADVQPDAVPWSAKVPRVVWRGITGGRVMGEGPRNEGKRLTGLLRRFAAGKILEADLYAHLSRLPRFHALTTVLGDQRFDFGFVDGAGYVISETPLHAPLGRPRLTRQEMQHSKYIAVLRGLDVGSSFYWVMNSGSVGFVMETPFQSFASDHFKPWQHYIPCREDCSDLVDRFTWAEANPEECRAMTRRAAEVCRHLARPDLRDEVLRRVIARINDMGRAA